MAYCTLADLTRVSSEMELTQLTDIGTGEIDEPTVDLAIDAASDQIDSYLRTRYQLPLLGKPPELVQIACDLARYLLCTDIAPTVVVKRRDDAINWLQQLAAGKVTIAAEYVQPVTAANPMPSMPTVISAKKVFTKSLLDTMP